MILAQELPLFDWSWVLRNLDQIWDRVMEHVALTAVAIGAGLVVSIVLTVVSLRWPRLYQPLSSASGVLYTIPSLAMFALLVPLFGLANNFLISEVALVSYTLLILLRNFVTGVRGVPEETIEAAYGMGYTDGEVLRRIRLPLATPVIVAGLRIATVTVIGLVTVTSLLGLGGLGFFILDGLRRSILFPTEIIVGVVLSIVLAATLDLLLLWMGRLLTPWARSPA